MFTICLFIQKSISASASNDAAIDIDRTYNPSSIVEQEEMPTTSTSQPLYAKRKPQNCEKLVYLFATQFISAYNPRVVNDIVKKAICDANTVEEFDEIFVSLQAEIGVKKGLNTFHFIKFMISNYLEDEQKLSSIQEAFIKAKEKSYDITFNETDFKRAFLHDLEIILTSNFNHGCPADIFITIIQLMYKIKSSEENKLRECQLSHGQIICFDIITKPLDTLVEYNDEYNAMAKIAKISARLIHDFHNTSEEQSHVIKHTSGVDDSTTMVSSISKLTNAFKSFFTAQSNLESEASEVVALNTIETLESNFNE